jgi:hypothetical protein
MQRPIIYHYHDVTGNKTFEGFHNSLGECYRILGRVKDAKTQFALALKLNPGYVSADYNMGLALQDNNEWDEAIHFYHKVCTHAPNACKPAGRRISQCVLHNKLDTHLDMRPQSTVMLTSIMCVLV